MVKWSSRGDSLIDLKLGLYWRKQQGLDEYEWLVCCSERGVVYKFQLSARNDINYGAAALQTIRTPDGSK